MRTLLQNVFTNAHVHKKFSRMFAKFLQMCKTQMCKSANVRKTVVHKMRKSAAQIFFQMQKSQIRKSALCTFLSANASFRQVHKFFFYVVKIFAYNLKKNYYVYKKII